MSESSESKKQPAAQAASTNWLTGRAPSPAMRMVDDLLSVPDKVKALSSVALHRVIAQIGPTEATELLAIATSEQVRELLDLQVWQGDRVDREQLLDWLYALTAVPEGARAAHMRGLDVELKAFLLRTGMRIYLANEENAPEEPEGSYVKTPDGWFILDLTDAEPHRQEQLMHIVEAMYVDDHEEARRLLQNVMWELPAELEEWSLRWRNGRLEDLGFEDPLSATRAYAYLDPRSVAVDEGTADRRSANAPEPVGRNELSEVLGKNKPGFWDKAIAAITDTDQRELLAEGLMALTNRVLSADRVDPADLEHAQESMSMLHGRLSLGLEYLAQGDTGAATSVLKHVALARIARVGFSLILDLQRQIHALARVGAFGAKAHDMSRLPPPLSFRISALLASRPRFCETDASYRPYRSLADLHDMQQAIDTALAAAALVPRGKWPEGIPDELTLAALFCTSLLEEVLAAEAPLTTEDVRTAVSAAKQPAWTDKLRELARQRVTSVKANAGDQHYALANAWVDQLAEQLAALDVDDIDPRYIDIVWGTEG